MASSDHRPALNALRGFAALTIIAFHFQWASTFPWATILPWLTFGHLAVEFFFVLSGLIISHIYLDAMIAGERDYRSFIFLRFARIFPVHFVIQLVAIPILIENGQNASASGAFDWVALTLFVHQLTFPQEFVWNVPDWSVNSEMFAYTFIFPAIVSISRDRSRSVTGLYLLCFGVIMLSVLDAGHGNLFLNAAPGPMIRIMGGFTIGAGLYCLLALCRRGVNWDWATLAGAVMIPAALAGGNDLAVLGALTLVLIGAYMSTGPIASFLSLRPLYVLGELSFSLYLCHWPILMLMKLMAQATGIDRGLLFCLAATVISVFTAALLYSYVEVPARTTLRHWWATRSSLTPTRSAGARRG